MAHGLSAELCRRLRAAQHWLVLSGSGISAESGVPTFRDAQTGLWARYAAEDLATPEAFARDPQLVWDWYQWRRELVSRARPNPAHRALALLENLVPRLTLITQNVDGLHQRAGSSTVLEFHGNLQTNRCATCNQVAEPDLRDDVRPPRCPRCAGLLRPGVVWFGEAIPPAALEAAFAAANSADLFLSVGTSSLVYPAAGLAQVALRNGALVIEINPNQTPLTRQADFHLGGPAGEWLPAIARQVKDSVSSGDHLNAPHSRSN